MDLRYSAGDEKFRTELRRWLAPAVPAHGAPPERGNWLSEDQKALQAAIGSFCDTPLPCERLRGLEDGDGFERHLWRALAEMGVFAARLLPVA